MIPIQCRQSKVQQLSLKAGLAAPLERQQFAYASARQSNVMELSGHDRVCLMSRP